MGGKIDTGKAAKMSRELVSLLMFQFNIWKKEMLAFENKKQAESKKYASLSLDNKSPCIDILSSVCSFSLQFTHQNPVPA